MLAAALGVLIGLERRLRGQAPGVRMAVLVCMCPAVFAEWSRVYGGDDRMASQIVAGVVLFGAGLFMSKGLSAKGVTTAAAIWLVAGVGIAVAMEFYIAAMVSAVVGVVLLEVRTVAESFGPREKRD